jgi:hypothetical protein
VARQQQPVDRHGDHARADGGERQGGGDRKRQLARQEQRQERAGREIETICQVDHPQHAKHQREAEGEQGIGCAQQDAVDELLSEHRAGNQFQTQRPAQRNVARAGVIEHPSMRRKPTPGW